MTRAALVVRGGWEGHQPVDTTDLFIPYLRANGFSVEVEGEPEVYADRERMAAVDLIVHCVSMGEASHEAVDGLRTAVASGAGLVGWHGGILDWVRAPEFLQLTGGQFVTHPAKAPGEGTGGPSDYFLPHRIEFTDLGREHPITRGLEDFGLETEQYWVLTDDLDEVLATTTHEAQPWQEWPRPVTVPAVWTRRWGAGRVVVLTPGHDVDTLQQPMVRTIVERGLLWAARD